MILVSPIELIAKESFSFSLYLSILAIHFNSLPILPSHNESQIHGPVRLSMHAVIYIYILYSALKEFLTNGSPRLIFIRTLKTHISNPNPNVLNF